MINNTGKINSEIPISDILQRLPHRYPFLMIDRILECDERKAVALKNVTINESFFMGHFPNVPIMPGVLIGEAMAQTAAFIGALTTNTDKLPNEDSNLKDTSQSKCAFLANMNLKITHPVMPGDQLVLTTKLLKCPWFFCKDFGERNDR